MRTLVCDGAERFELTSSSTAPLVAVQNLCSSNVQTYWQSSGGGSNSIVVKFKVLARLHPACVD